MEAETASLKLCSTMPSSVFAALGAVSFFKFPDVWEFCGSAVHGADSLPAPVLEYLPGVLDPVEVFVLTHGRPPPPGFQRWMLRRIRTMHTRRSSRLCCRPPLHLGDVHQSAPTDKSSFGSFSVFHSTSFYVALPKTGVPSNKQPPVWWDPISGATFSPHYGGHHTYRKIYLYIIVFLRGCRGICPKKTQILFLRGYPGTRPAARRRFPG